MMSHLSEEILNQYLDRELPSSQRFEVESHLAGCAVCQASLKEIETVFGSLAEWQSVPLPFDISQSVIAQLDPKPEKARGIRPLVWVGLAFQAITGLVLGFLVYPWIAGLALPGMVGLDFSPLWQTLQSLDSKLTSLPDFLSEMANFLPGVSFGNIGLVGWLGIIVGLGLGWLSINALLLKSSTGETQPAPQRR